MNHHRRRLSIYFFNVFKFSSSKLRVMKLNQVDFGSNYCLSVIRPIKACQALTVPKNSIKYNEHIIDFWIVCRKSERFTNTDGSFY